MTDCFAFMKRRWAGVLGLLVAGFLCLGAGPQGPRWGTALAFHGWSPTSRYVAYTRKRTRRPKSGKRRPAITIRHAHKRVEEGEMRLTGARFGRDAGRFARANGYLKEPVEVRVVDPTIREFVAPEGTYRFQVHVGEELRWVFSLGGEVLMEQPFDTLYVGVEAEVYPSPDRRHVALVLHLDTGWLIDGGFYVAGLPGKARERWQRAAMVGPPIP